MKTSCPGCGHINPVENRFCGMCGGRMERRRTPDSELLPEDCEHSGPSEPLPIRLPAQSPHAPERGAAHEAAVTDRQMRAAQAASPTIAVQEPAPSATR